MTLLHKLGLLALALVAVSVALAGVYATGYASGYSNGTDSMREQWEEAQQAARTENERVRKEGFALAQTLEKKLADLEVRYGTASAKLRDALNAKVACPASGRLGDIVLPAAVVDSMFGNAGEAGPATGQPTR